MIQDKLVHLDSQVDRVILVSQDNKERVDLLDLLAQPGSLELRARLEREDNRELLAREVLMVHQVLSDLQDRLVNLGHLELSEPPAVEVLLASKVHRVWLESREKLDLLVFKDSQDFLVSIVSMF